MKFATIRRALFQIHMWVGLVLGLFLIVLTLSGAILVYDDKIADLFNAPPKAVTAGQRLPISMLAASARGVAEARGFSGQATVVLPEEVGDAAIVRFMRAPAREGARDGARDGASRARGDGASGARREGAAPPPARGGGIQIYLDPVSGQVLGTRRAGLPPVFALLHQIHGSFTLGRDFGRPFVGWLGVAMLALGVSGLVLWWPKRGQWKYAFLVRSTAKGLRFHRELHAAAGIWIFVVFMAVSFSGVAITFPQTVRALVGGGEAPRPGFNLREGPRVEPVADAKRIAPDAALLIAQTEVPGGVVRSVTIPARPAQAYSVALASRFGTTATVFINPYTAAVIAVRDPANGGGADSFMALQRPMHDGQGLGPVWEFLVFLSGLVPTLFVITGVIMWWKKRQRRLPMSRMTDEVAPPEAV